MVRWPGAYMGTETMSESTERKKTQKLKKLTVFIEHAFADVIDKLAVTSKDENISLGLNLPLKFEDPLDPSLTFFYVMYFG